MNTNFVATTVGLDYAEVNLIDWRSRVQVFQGTMGFYVAVPASVRNTGVRAVSAHATLDDALSAAALIVPAQTVKMDKIHARALKMNAAK